MRHAIRGRKLGRTTSHRLAMFRNQLVSLVVHERIVTTLPKAKELRPLAEKLVTRGKKGSVADRRLAGRVLHDREHIKKLFDDIGPRFADRAGGYLRIVKLGPRQGDGAETAALQFVDYDPDRGGPAEDTAKDKGGKVAKPTKTAKGKAAKGKDEEKAKSEKAKQPLAKTEKVKPERKGGPAGRGKGRTPADPGGKGKKKGTRRAGDA